MTWSRRANFDIFEQISRRPLVDIHKQLLPRHCRGCKKLSFAVSGPLAGWGTAEVPSTPKLPLI